ncbi:thermonuclease family protein [Erythrobacter sp.]|uniref:thermonuclease family protein n=1 Tax=Erythrobacter sp. TaxID=1042 RepID=UPI003C789DBF
MTGTRIRLAYIDAPEARQTCEKAGVSWACGEAATEALASIVDGQPVSCTLIATDVYARQVAECHTRVFTLGREMVRRGMAVTLDNAPHEYGEAAEIAKSMNAGL